MAGERTCNAVVPVSPGASENEDVSNAIVHPLGSVAGGATLNRKSEVPQSALFRFVSETVNCSSLPATPEGEEAGVITSCGLV